MNTKLNKEQLDSYRNKRIQELTKEELAIEEVFNIAYYKMYSQGEIQHILKNSPIDFLKDCIVDMVLKGSVEIEYVPSVFLEDYDIALYYAKTEVVSMEQLPTHFKDEEDFIHAVVFDEVDVLKYATPRVKDNENILNTALKYDKKAFKYFPDKYKSKENCLIALEGTYPSYAENWQYVPEPLCSDIEFIKEAGKVSKKIYEFLKEEIKNDLEITQYFLNLDNANIVNLSEEYKNDKNLIQPILDKNPNYLQFAGEKLKNNVDFVFPIIKKTPNTIHECGETIKDNIEIAKYVCNIRTYPLPMKFFSEEIKSNPTIAMISILRCPDSMLFISPTLSSNKEFISSYIEQHGFNAASLPFISKELRNDYDTMKKAYDAEKVSISYIGEELRYNNKFLREVFSAVQNEKKLSENELLNNLSFLDLKEGEEGILFNFCNHSKLDINDIQTKADILSKIKDKKFVELLKEEEDLYSYLSASSLSYKLEDSVIKKEVKGNKKKI